jgi:hypothetical protein
VHNNAEKQIYSKLSEEEAREVMDEEVNVEKWQG